MIDLFTAMRVELQLYAVPWNNCIVHTVRGRGPAEAEAWRRGGGVHGGVGGRLQLYATPTPPPRTAAWAARAAGPRRSRVHPRNAL